MVIASEVGPALNNPKLATTTAGSVDGPTSSPLLALTLKAAEHAWLFIASLANSMNDQDRLIIALEHILRLNPFNITALWQYGKTFEQNGQYIIAKEAYQRILKNNANNVQVVEVLAALGRCYLMLDELGKSYQTLQQSLLGYQTLGISIEGDFWYWIGLLYDRYGSEEHAFEAFVASAKATRSPIAEAYFRIGMLMRNRGKYDLAMNCFKYVLTVTSSSSFSSSRNYRHPLINIGPGDVLLQMALVEDAQGEYAQAKEILEKLTSEGNPRSQRARLLLAWLYVRPETPFYQPDHALMLLTNCIEENNQDPLAWYYLGRLHKDAERYPLAYEAYRQAVSRDSRNCAFWNSIGLLYAEIGQLRDSLDAYTRALQLVPNCAVVWYNLASLYEAGGTDASESLKKAQDLDVTGKEQYRKELDPLRFSERTPVPIPSQRPLSITILNTLPTSSCNRTKRPI
jgi:glucose repression mediator protein